MSHINPFTGEKKDNVSSSWKNKDSNTPNNSTSSFRPANRSWEQQNNKSKNYTNNNNRYRVSNNYSNGRPYRVYSKPAPKKPEFNLENDNFPTLSGTRKHDSTTTSNMDYSKTLSTFKKGSRINAHPTPEKKFVSLVNLNKKNKNKEEEYETDEELQKEAFIEYNSADEQLEEFYEQQEKKYTDNEY